MMADDVERVMYANLPSFLADLFSYAQLADAHRMLSASILDGHCCLTLVAQFVHTQSHLGLMTKIAGRRNDVRD